MAEYKITNGKIEAMIDSVGAELKSLIDCNTGEEFMWSANPEHWGSTSPMLFPFIGGLKNKEYRFDGKTYPMEKHGFVRKADFTVESQKEDEIWFSLKANEEQLEVYPFAFLLEIGYIIKGKKLSVKWRVQNTQGKEIHFSIGGHPGFKCPRNEGEKQTDCYLRFPQKEVLNRTLIGSDGLASHEIKKVLLDNGDLRITERLFDQDALVLEDYQVNEIIFLDSQKNPYVKVNFETPVVGVWSAYGGKAPFICIEPWEGICDFTDFTGSLEERKWGVSLTAGEVFEKGYEIELF